MAEEKGIKTGSIFGAGGSLQGLVGQAQQTEASVPEPRMSKAQEIIELKNRVRCLEQQNNEHHHMLVWLQGVVESLSQELDVPLLNKPTN